MEEPNEELTSNGEGTESPPIDPEKVRKARDLTFEGDRPPRSDVMPGSDEDPALQEDIPTDPTSKERTRQCIGLSRGVLGFASTALEIAYDINLTDREIETLAESGGKALRHYIELREGEKKGDVLRFAGEATAVGTKKLKEFKTKQLEKPKDEQEN